MSPRGPDAVALTLGFTSLRSHPVPSLRWECENTIEYFFLASFSAPWCYLRWVPYLVEYGIHFFCFRRAPLDPGRPVLDRFARLT